MAETMLSEVVNVSTNPGALANLSPLDPRRIHEPHKLPGEPICPARFATLKAREKRSLGIIRCIQRKKVIF